MSVCLLQWVLLVIALEVRRNRHLVVHRQLRDAVAVRQALLTIISRVVVEVDLHFRFQICIKHQK